MSLISRPSLISARMHPFFCVGSGRSRRQSRAEVDPNHGEAADAAEDSVAWTIYLAVALSKIAYQLQKELLDERIITYVAEWCSTPDQRRAGLSYSNVCVLYDQGDKNLELVKHRPENNVYLAIPHPLTDAVLDSHVRDLQQFHAHTFWANAPVFRCFQAAQALARRYENIDRCFLGLSPGGVGQSLYSTHLAAMYGNLHTFFDPNIFYQDEELRNIVEQFVGCIILTGQEAPQSSRKMREDIYKKVMSADGLCSTESH